MPVSLCEWRVRIGTFVHWIRDYEIKERKERLLKERIRRMKVLCERLKAKMNDSEQDSEEDDEGESREDGSSPIKHKQCPHKTTNSQSSGDSYIKDLLTSCDQCIHDLLTSHCCSTDLLTPADGCIRKLLKHCDNGVKDMITPDYRTVKDLLRSGDYIVKDLITPEDCSIKDLITPEDCSIKDLITPEDCSVKDLITPEDCSVKDLITPEDCSIKDLITPEDCEKQSLSQCSVKEQLTTPCLETHKGLGPRLAQSDHLSMGLLESAVSKGKDLLQLSDFCIHEPRRSGDSFIRDNRKMREPYTSGKEQHAWPDTLTNERPIGTNAVTADQVSYESYKQFQTSTDTPVEEKSSVMVPHSSRLHCNSEQHEKAKPNGTSTSLCPVPSFKSKTSLIPEEIPPVAELLLLRSGDVELNPGPRQGPGWSLDLERELKSLVDEISPECYTVLCNRLGFGRAQSKSILSKNLLDVSESLFEIICSWGVKQRDGTNYKEVLADKLRSVNLDALGRKLLQGGYRMTEPPAPCGYRMTEPPASGGDRMTEPPAPADLDPQDTPQPLIDMTEEQVIKCGEDLKAFYLEEICKIKPDPLDFNSVLEFERIYTNLTLLRSKTPLDYNALLTTKVNGILPKRLMVEGEGGVGKTTLCSKIAWDWANGSPQFKRFSWVLVIPLRNVIKGQTVGDIVKNYLSDSNSVTPAQIDNYIRSQPTKVLIVLDGLDEYDGDLFSEEDSDISQILLRKKFKECTALVTTRPWRADQIKCNRDLSRSYAFIAVKGFSPENVSSYIKKYFVNDKNAGSELIKFIEVNDVIKENMAPFPIYVAMLCILWENSDSEKRETMRRLKTFSQLFDQMVMFLRDHYVSKLTQILHEAHLGKEMENINSCLLEIGPIAFKGLLSKRLTFNEKDFISCTKAMETCCRIGVLTREKQNISRWERNLRSAQFVTTSVFFPHKLFQEYISAMYLATLYDTDSEKYKSFLDRVMSVANPEEFRYLLYFTAAQGKDVGLDIVEKIQQNKVESSRTYFSTIEGGGTAVWEQRTRNDFLVDITFEAYNKDTAKSVGRRIFAEDKILTIDKEMSAHTMSGYLFIMEQHGMETLIFRGRSCGPTVSRDLADVLCSSSSLSRLEFYRTTLDEDFYRMLQDQTSSAGVISVKELYVDHRFLGDLQRFRVTVGELFPGLQLLRLSTPQTVTPGVVERLTHPNLSVLSIKADLTRQTSYRDVKEVEQWPVPLIGEPASLGRLFSSSFPQLTSLSFKGLVIGNKRCEAILRSLRNHQNMKSTSFISCFTDDELDFLARQISKENGIAITLDHDLAQTELTCISTADLMDALCHRTCIRRLYIDQGQDCMVRSREWFSEVQGTEMDSKVTLLELRDDQSASCCLGKFICLLPCLTDLTIWDCSFHDEFFKEIVDHASSSKIQTFTVQTMNLYFDQSASCCLGRFICLLPCLTDLTIEGCSFHDEFYKEIVDRASSSKIQTFTVLGLHLPDQSASCYLRKFICLLPCLKDLTIEGCSFHDEFYKEIADRASSSKIQTFTVESMELCDDQSASCCLGKFICLLPCLTDLRIALCYFHEEFYKEIADRASSSKIQTFTVMYLELRDDQSASCCLGRFICLLPCLTDLTIRSCSFHDEFYKEIADRASSSKIKTFTVVSLKLHDDQSASCCLGKFICLLPCLTDLRIRECSFHDEFYKEIAERASSSKIQTLTVISLQLHDDQSASCCLGRFICLLPCLTDLTIWDCSFRDEFYKEIADRASSSKIKTFTVVSLKLHDDQSASCCLGRFICLLPCLADLRIGGCSFHDEFYKEIADRASYSKIQTLDMSFLCGRYGVIIGQSASKQLARFLCSLPCLTDLTLKGYDLHDDFYTELTSLAASSQNPYFRNKKHMGMLEEWSQSKELFNQHHQAVIPAYQHNPRSWEQLGPNILQPRQSAHPSVQYQNDHQRPIQSEHQQVHVYDSDRDRPSTSGLRSADICRAGSTSVGSEGTSVHVGKRRHSDSDSDNGTVSTSESKQRQSGKRRTKTDRNPDSP